MARLNRAGSYNYTPVDDTNRFLDGVAAVLTRCPRCANLLVREPAYLRCRYGCGRLWPVHGGNLTLQFEYERASGLTGGDIASVTDLSAPSRRPARGTRRIRHRVTAARANGARRPAPPAA